MILHSEFFAVTLKLNVVIYRFRFLSHFGLPWVHQTQKGLRFFRTIFYLRLLVTHGCNLIWNLISITTAVLLIDSEHIWNAPQGFFIDKNQALWCIVIIATWKGCGYWMMFILAGLKNIDTSIYESAKIDGSGFLTTVVKITLPLLKKVLLFVLVANTTANLLLFAPMQLVTQGGPQGSTNVLMFEAYKSAFKYANQPRASALITVLLVLIVTICIVQFKFLNEKEERVA